MDIYNIVHNKTSFISEQTYHKVSLRGFDGYFYINMSN